MRITDKTLAKLALTALTLVSIPSIGTSQGYSTPGLQLPPNASQAVGKSFGQMRVFDALRRALNSDGDRMTVSLEGEVGIARSTTGASVRADLERVGDGYEISLAGSVARGLGFDAFHGLEFGVHAAGETSVVFGFPRLDSAVASLHFMALLQKIKVPQLLEGIATQKVLITATDQMLKAAMAAVGASRYAVLGAEKAYGSMYRSYKWAASRMRSVGKWLSKASKKVRWAKKKIGKLPRWLRGPVKKILQWASRALDRARSAHSWITREFRRVEHALGIAERRLRRAREKYERSLKTEQWRRQALEGLKKELARLESFADMLAEPMSFQASRVVAVEFTLSGGATVEASLRPAGVELANLGGGIEGAAELAATVRYDFVPRELSLTGALGAEMSGDVGAVLGARASAAAEFALTAVWRKASRHDPFRLDPSASSANFEMDLEVLAVGGLGVTAEFGAGRSVGVEVDWQRWETAVRAHRALFRDFSVSRLGDALRSVSADVSIQDRWIAGSRSAIGFDVKVFEISLEGNAHWHDSGRPLVFTADAGAAIGGVVEARNLRHTASMLRAVAR